MPKNETLILLEKLMPMLNDLNGERVSPPTPVLAKNAIKRTFVDEIMYWERYLLFDARFFVVRPLVFATLG